LSLMDRHHDSDSLYRDININEVARRRNPFEERERKDAMKNDENVNITRSYDVVALNFRTTFHTRSRIDKANNKPSKNTN
jgi:hypothetical protein